MKVHLADLGLAVRQRIKTAAAHDRAAFVNQHAKCAAAVEVVGADVWEVRVRVRRIRAEAVFIEHGADEGADCAAIRVARGLQLEPHG